MNGGAAFSWPLLVSKTLRLPEITQTKSVDANKLVVVVALRRWAVPNIGRQLVLQRCIHCVAEQLQSRIRPESNRALHNQPFLVVHDDLQALELVGGWATESFLSGPYGTMKGIQFRTGQQTKNTRVPYPFGFGS